MKGRWKDCVIDLAVVEMIRRYRIENAVWPIVHAFILQDKMGRSNPDSVSPRAEDRQNAFCNEGRPRRTGVGSRHHARPGAVAAKLQEKVRTRILSFLGIS